MPFDGLLAPRRPGRRRNALLITGAMPTEDAPLGLLQAMAFRRLGYEVAIAPADGRRDSPGELLADGGIRCLGRPAFRSVEEMLRDGAAFDVVLLQGVELARAYEPLLRLHAPAAAVLCALPDRSRCRQALLAAYACDVALVATAIEAAWFQASLPGSTVHAVDWRGAACDQALSQALEGAPRLSRATK